MKQSEALAETLRVFNNFFKSKTDFLAEMTEAFSEEAGITGKEW